MPSAPYIQFLCRVGSATLHRWHSASLRVHLLVQLSLALGILLVVFLYTSVQALNTSTQEALQERAVVARLMADRMDDQLSSARQILSSALASDELDLQDNTLEPEKKLLPTLYHDSILFKRIYLLDSTGVVLWMAPYEKRMMGANMAAAPYNMPIFTASQASFFPAMGYRSQTPGLSVTLPISSTGKTLGYLYGWIDLADPRAASLLYPYQPHGDGYTDLIDQAGTILASTLPERVAQIRDHASYLSTLIKDKRSVVGSCHSCHSSQDVRRQNTVLAFAPLRQVPWGVAVYQPESEVFAETRDLTLRLAALGLGVLVAFLGLVWVTTRDTIQPMQILTKACQQIAAGDLSHPVPAVGLGEAATLAHSFEQMRRDLAHYQERTQTWQRDLEHRVEERTAELVRYRDYLLRSNRNLTALNSVAAVLVHSLDRAETLNVALDRVLETMSGDAAGIFLLDDQETTLDLVASRGLPDAASSQINRVTRVDLNWHAACIQALDRHLASSSMLCVPLEEKAKYRGTLFVSSNRQGHFNAEDETLLVSIGWQISMGVRNARLYSALRQEERARAQLLHQVISAQEDERIRIARELHDDTGQSLSALILGLDVGRMVLTEDVQKADAHLQDLQTIAEGILRNTRRIIADLRPSLLDDLGLGAAIAWYGEQRLNPLGITLHLNEDSQLDRLPRPMETALFRIVQEGMTNVVRHAHASTVTVNLVRQDGRLVLEIVDDGCGFDPQLLSSNDLDGKGLGLRGMQERASILGGDFYLDTAPGGGTTIKLSVPLPESEVDDA